MVCSSGFPLLLPCVRLPMRPYVPPPWCQYLFKPWLEDYHRCFMWGGCHLGRLGPPPHPSLECFLHHRFEIVVSSKQYHHPFWLYVIRSYLAEIISKNVVNPCVLCPFVRRWRGKTAQSKGLTCIVAPAPPTCVIQHGILNQLTDCLTAWLDSLPWSLEWCPNLFFCRILKL